MTIDPNDPKLTAYVLGELDDAERAEVEAGLPDSPEAREAVEDIRRVADLLTAELGSEPVVGLTQDHRAKIDERIAEVPGLPESPRTSRMKFVWVATGVAASIAAAITVASLFMPSLKSARQVAWPRSTTEQAEVPPVCAANAKQLQPGPVRLRREQSLKEVGERLRSSEYVGFSPGLVDETPNVFSDSRSNALIVMGPAADVNRVRSLIDDGRLLYKRTGWEDQVHGCQDAPAGEVVTTLETLASSRAAMTELEAQTAALERLQNTYVDPAGPTVTPEDRQALERTREQVRTAYLNSQHALFLARERLAAMEQAQAQHNTEAYDAIVENPFRVVEGQQAISTFSIDVDTASYANVRRFLTQGQLPPKGAVRIEEMINYFTYDYPQPEGEAPFSVNVEIADCPWHSGHRLAKIGLQGREVPVEERPATNLVFLLDVSGSMRPANKLPLLKQAMGMLVEQLDEGDRVAIVVYAGASGLALDSTTGDKQDAILGALDRLQAGGSTNGGAGIQLAYDIAGRNFIEGGSNRVILATDGDFNVGTTNQGDLIQLIEERARGGVFLTVLGFGMGNYKDSTLEKLADKGNGNYAYIDTLREAQKVLVEQMSGTLITIAKDVKIQIEFNPAQAAAYRLIGYENRILAAEDFNDDAKDAGEIGAGHTVTALYEIIPAGQAVGLPSVDPLKYQQPTTTVTGSDEMMTVKLRYKPPDGDKSLLLGYPITDTSRTLAEASPDFQFAAAVASFGMLLRDSQHKGDATFASVLDLAAAGLGEKEDEYRTEFIGLVQKAKELSPQ